MSFAKNKNWTPNTESLSVVFDKTCQENLLLKYTSYTYISYVHCLMINMYIYIYIFFFFLQVKNVRVVLG